MTPEDVPEVDALVRALEEHRLSLSVGAPEPLLQLRAWRRVHLTGPDGLALSLAVDDEYDDATEGNQALLLHLVLATCECFEEADDFVEWAEEAEMDAAKSWTRQLYQELAGVVPRIREAVGPEAKAISSWDFNLNAGAARVLRNR